MSHREGSVGTGTEFKPGTAGLQPGEHFLTVEAFGSGGASIQRVAAVTVRSSEGSPAEGLDQDEESPPEKTGPKRNFSGGRSIGEETQNQIVSTVVLINGNVRMIRNGKTEAATADTSFTAGDIIELRGRNASLTLLNTITTGIVTLNKSNATYVWNSSSSTWAEE
jgi:hypothetical protein